MHFKRTIKRFAHLTGYTYVTYSENGEIITSGSSDGELRIWKEVSDDDPISQCIGENANCCVQYSHDEPKNMRLVVSSANIVQAFKYPEFESCSDIELRFSAPVTSIKVNKMWIVAGSEDSMIKAQSLTKSGNVVELKGHTGPIFHIDLSANNHLASSSGDGTIRIWNLETLEVVKMFDGLQQFTKFADAKTYHTPAFEKSGRYLAFPREKLINVLETTNWDIKFKLENNEITSNYSVCSFSFCGSYLAAGTSNGEISIWSLADNVVIKGDYFGEENHAITSIEWNPKNNEEVAFCDADGQLSTIKLKQPGKKYINDEVEENDVEEKNYDPDDIYEGIDFRDDEDEDNENCVALEKLKNETLKINFDSDEDDDSKSVKSQRVDPERYVPVSKPFQLQPSFQPGSTPDHLEHRFMMWNHVGQVLCHNSSEENSIIVEFHNAALHPSLHILNSLNHQIASLSTTCLALASKESPCKMVCIALLSSGNKEWSTTMSDCEEIRAIAAGASFVAIATDAGYIRLFTTMGTQREIIMVPGQVVCLSADENKLVVVFHTSDTCNKYSIMIITILGLTVTNRIIELPLSKNSKLNWIGFSDCGSIVAYESTGRMLSYNIKRNLWMPICDLNNHVIGASDTFFIVSVSERSQKIRATLCRGTNYPLTNPRPIMREIEYSLPLCFLETEKSKLEEALVRSFNFDMESSNKLLIENGLKLFSTALNSELESRAFEIVELIGDRKLIELASKYASQKGRMHMAGKISKLLNDFEEKELEKKSILTTFERDTESFTEIYEAHDPKNDDMKQQKCETSTPLIAPRPMISQRKSNPFKKTLNKSGMSNTGALNHLTKKSIGYSDSVPNFDDENTPSNNLSKSNRSMIDTPRPGNFTQWFIANKQDIKENNPNSSEIELLKLGKSIYKDLTHKTKSTPDESDLNSSVSLNKRKLDMNDETGGVSKLAKFGYIEN